MSVTTTTHYGLKKPDGTEYIKPDPFNDNADTLDDLLFKKHTVGTATLSTTGWTGSAAPYSYALAISGLLATDTVIIDCVTVQDASSAAAIKAAWALTANYGLDDLQAAGQITMYASAKPTINIPVRYTVWR